MKQRTSVVLGIIFFAFIGSLPAMASAQGGRRVPTIDDLLLVKSAGGATISPDGKWVAYTVAETDFKQDAYVTQIWLADAATGSSFQLTRGEKSSSGPDWSPDGKWLAFTSSRIGDKSQLFLISPAGGEAIQITKSETGVSGFEWSPDGKSIVFAASDPVSKTMKDRKEYMGDYEVVRREYNHAHLWTFNLAEALKEPQAGRQRTKGKDFTVGSFSWSPDGSKIAFSATINPDLINGATSDIYVLNLADDSVKKIVAQPGPDSSPHWSPDGKEILFSTYMGNPKYNANDSRLALVPAEGGPIHSLTDSFDENPGYVAWTNDGIYFSALQKTAAHLFRLDPATLKITRITSPDNWPALSRSPGTESGWPSARPRRPHSTKFASRIFPSSPAR
jgi:Tol biopolymer transport system component